MNPGEYANLEAAEEQMWWFRGMKRILFGLVDPLAAQRSRARVLEVGCGTGAMARLLQRRYGWDVVPCDLSEEGLRSARRSGTLRLVRADALQLPFGAAAFDALVTLDMLVHLAPGEESQAFDEFVRVLKPGGLLILRAAAFRALRSRHSDYVGERQRYSRARLRREAERCGLRILRATYANSLLLPVAWAKFRLWEPLTRAPVASSVGLGPNWLESALHAALSLEASAIASGLDLPAGQSIILIAERS